MVAQAIEREKAEQLGFMYKVYAIMTLGLGLTGTMAMIVARIPALTELVFGNRLVFYGLLGAELICVISFVALVEKVNWVTAAGLFIFYAALNGVTFSFIFLVYTTSSIASAFFVTAGTFAAMSAYGYVTKRDLTSWGSFLFMGLIGLIIASVVNLFLGSELIYWLTTFAGVLIFTGLTAYDTQKIKELNKLGNAGTAEDHKEAIHGALILYLDFINLFLYLLRLFGRRD
jgi:FtsH-binding integral membrane protein